jgi:hypothetical protein
VGGRDGKTECDRRGREREREGVIERYKEIKRGSMKGREGGGYSE